MSAPTTARRNVDSATIAFPAVVLPPPVARHETRPARRSHSVGDHFVLIAQVVFGLLIGSQVATLVLTSSPATATHSVIVLAVSTFGLAVLLLTSRVSDLIDELRAARERR